MKNLLRSFFQGGFILLCGIFFLSLIDCNSDTSKKATQESESRRALIVLIQSKPDCEKNATGTVYFSNTSTTNKTYDIIWDGSLWATVVPSGRSSTFVVASGQHTLVFKITNTNSQACTQSTPNIAICSNAYYYCSN